MQVPLNKSKKTPTDWTQSAWTTWIRRFFLVAVLGYLLYKIWGIGWVQIWNALPTNPFFYLIFLLLYFLLPLVEVLIYRLSWSFDAVSSIPAFVKKRVYNKDLLGYSGEVFFYTWARKNVKLTELELLKTIRDNNVVSSVASTLIALLLVAIFVYVGHFSITDIIGNQSVSFLIGIGLLIAVSIPITIRFRKYIFSMPFKLALTVFGIQCGRLLVGQVLQISQWAIVMPDVNLSVWFTFAALSIVLTRIPIIPSQNLIFLGIGVELSYMVGIPQAAMFGMLGVIAALDKLLNFVMLFLITTFGKDSPSVEQPSAVEQVAESPVTQSSDELVVP